MLLPKVGQKRNYSIMVAGWVIITCLFVAVIAGPDQKYGSYAFAVIYGGWYVDADSEFAGTIATLLTFELLISYGHYYPTTNGYFVSLVPEDKVVELWGWNMFAGTLLLPALT